MILALAFASAFATALATAFDGRLIELGCSNLTATVTPIARPPCTGEKEVVAGLAVQTTDPASRRGTSYTKLRSHWNHRPW